MNPVWMIAISLTLSFPAAGQNPATQAHDDSQVDALAKQKISELFNAVQHSDIGTSANDVSGQKAGLHYDVHMSDCENRWVALYHKPEDSDYTYGFVYIDPDAGFTVQYGGVFTIDSAGKYHLARNPISPEKMNLKIRLDQNGIAALLPPEALAELRLPEKPDWLKFYEDKADPIAHKVNWGFYYNGIGDSQRALDYLEPAYKERPEPRVAFELSYAYNATGRSEDAVRVGKSEFTKNPKNEFLCREIAFAYLRLKSYRDAVGQYQACVALCADSDSGMAEKSELAMNMSAAYEALGDTTNRNVWLERAKSWAPKGSAVYKHFHPKDE